MNDITTRRAIEVILSRLKMDNETAKILRYHLATEIQKENGPREEPADCLFLYFKPGGKWKYEGRGRFPRPQDDGWHDVDRAEIMRENGGMPGIVGGAEDLVVVAIPDESCDVKTAWPRMLLVKEVSS